MKSRLLLNFCLLAWSAGYAQKEPNKVVSGMNSLAGTYTLLLVDNIKTDGSRVHLYGDKPQGILMLDNSGHYCLQILSDGRPKFAAADKSKGTDEENRL